MPTLLKCINETELLFVSILKKNVLLLFSKNEALHVNKIRHIRTFKTILFAVHQQSPSRVQ